MLVSRNPLSLFHQQGTEALQRLSEGLSRKQAKTNLVLELGRISPVDGDSRPIDM